MALEWDAFVNGIIFVGIYLSDDSDQLVWDFHKNYGCVITNLAYSYLIKTHLNPGNSWWTSRLWNGKMPLKIMCFSGLCFHHKILT